MRSTQVVASILIIVVLALTAGLILGKLLPALSSRTTGESTGGGDEGGQTEFVTLHQSETRHLPQFQLLLTLEQLTLLPCEEATASTTDTNQQSEESSTETSEEDCPIRRGNIVLMTIERPQMAQANADAESEPPLTDRVTFNTIPGSHQGQHFSFQLVEATEDEIRLLVQKKESATVSSTGEEQPL